MIPLQSCNETWEQKELGCLFPQLFVLVIVEMDSVVQRRDGDIEEEKEQGRSMWWLDSGAMVGWFAGSQVAGGPKDTDCCCCLL